MKVTYLFGAGASKEALPIVKDLPDRMRAIIDFITDHDGSFPDNETYEQTRIAISKKSALESLIKDLKWLADESQKHASVDTLAKKFWLKSEITNLKRLKVTLSIYFTLEQGRQKCDFRYDAFFASLLKESVHKLPENINIISWNYDFQFEKAFSEFIDSNELNRIQYHLNVISKFDYRNPANQGFAIFKVNGTTTLFDFNKRSHYQYSDKLHDSLSKELIDSVLTNYLYFHYSDLKLDCGLSFSWEIPPNNFIDVITATINSTKDTDILVVIGYSFPYFNREIDRKIIQGMKKLTKVYLQSPEAASLRTRILSADPRLVGIEMVEIKDTTQFYLPNEL